jgi:hypothetical protein
MNVAEFFYKLWVVANVEVIIALLPECSPLKPTAGLSGPPVGRGILSLVGNVHDPVVFGFLDSAESYS